MTRQLESGREAKEAKRRELIYRAVNGGLYASVSHAGGVLQGFSVKLSEYDCLLTLRADFPAGRMIAHVGGYDVGDVLHKAAKGAKGDDLRWSACKWYKGTVDGE